MKSLLIRIFKTLGLTVGRFNPGIYEERKEYFRHKKIFDKYKEFTMIPFRNYLNNLEIAGTAAGTEGDIVECGVWRGGMIAGIAEKLGPQRQYWLFDSFEGLPPAEPADGEAALKWQRNRNSPDYFDNCSAGQDYAENAMKLSGAKNVRFVKGWFNETVANAGVKKIALLRLDGDWYESTMTCLEALYHKVSDGGIIIIDDYYFWDGCTKAVHDFLSRNKLTDRICQSVHGVAYIIRNKNYNDLNN